MKRNKIYIAISIINILFGFLIVLDGFLLPPNEILRTLQNKTVEKTRFVRINSYETYFLIDNENKKYNVPIPLYSELELGDHFVILRTELFKKAIGIGFKSENEYSFENIGTFNSSLFGTFVIAIDFLLLFIVILFPFSENKKYLIARFTFNATLISIIIGIFYFHFQG